MPISPELLPSELHYIIPLAEQHGSEARVEPFDQELQRHVVYAEKLAETDLVPLRKLYEEIRAKGHANLINEWHQAQSRETCPPETTFPIYGLLVLFSQLKKLDVAPFNDGAVGPQEKAVALDWNKLPPQLRYLAGPAEVYGAIQFEGAILDFLRERMTPEQHAELRTLSQRFEQDREAIYRWLDELGITKYREAALVYFTGFLLGHGDDLGLWNDPKAWIGQWIVIAAIVVVLLLELFVTGMGLRNGKFDCSDLVRVILTGLLLLQVWNGAAWARWLMSLLLIVSGVFAVVVVLKAESLDGRPWLLAIGAVGGVFTLLGLGLATKWVGAFQHAQRNRKTHH